MQKGLHDWASPGTDNKPPLREPLDGLHAPRPL